MISASSRRAGLPGAEPGLQSARGVPAHRSLTIFSGHPCSNAADFSGGSDRKASAYNAGDPGSIPGSGRSPGEGNGNPLQYLPGKSHGQRSLVGYSRGGHKESDTTEQLHVHVNFSSYHDFAFSVNSHGIHPFAQSKVLDYFPSYLTCNMSSNSAVSSSRDVLIQLLHLPCRYLIQVTISLYLDDCTSFLLPLLPPGYSRTAIRANPTKMRQTT